MRSGSPTAATLWNHARIAAAHHVRSVALWRPRRARTRRFWGRAPRIPTRQPPVRVPPAIRVSTTWATDHFLALSLAPEAGRARAARRRRPYRRRALADVAVGPILVRRAGIVPGKVALTFDDGNPIRVSRRRSLRRPQTRARCRRAFFVNSGSQAALYPSMVRARPSARDTRSATHSFTHPQRRRREHRCAFAHRAREHVAAHRNRSSGRRAAHVSSHRR